MAVFTSRKYYIIEKLSTADLFVFPILVLYIVYSSDLTVLYLSHPKQL